MRNYLLAAAAAAATMTAAPAFAQGVVGPNTGLRLEGIVGYDRARVPDQRSEGVTYGAAVGYDVQAGGAVIGAEAEVTDSNTDECTRGVRVANDTFCSRFGRDLYVGGRVGAAVGPNSVIYGKAGYTNARLSTDYSTGVIGAGTTATENLDGIRVGGGAEFGIGPNSYVKTEYRYSNYEQGVDRHQVVAGFGFRF
ncbi:MAG: outer membrane protein [Allosphingosinicella sp.]|uniref:outer membrane protein n=1 Tax=Allosphingosinicella sp. TaxID=2823234 RepID=UPI003938618D